MKINEVPQDGKRMLKLNGLVHYAENEEGKFEKVLSNGWEPGYYSGYNIQVEFDELAEGAKKRIRSNESSSLEYFMYKACMDLPALSQFTEIPKRKVKKHLTPRGFEKLDDETLARYAHVLHTDIETIRKFKSTLS